MPTVIRTYSPGEILRHGFQADVYGGQFRLVEEIEPGRWTVEAVAPDEETIGRIIEQAERYAETGGYPWSLAIGHDDPWEAAEAEVAQREDRAGERTVYRLITTKEERARYHENF